MKSQTVSVRIVAAVHNRRDLTLQCLASIARFDCPEIDIGVVIVDDGSTDGTSEAIREKFPDVTLVQGDGHLWYTEGTNVGIRRALDEHPDYILLINDDQVFDDKCLSHLVDTAETVPNSVVGPLLFTWDVPHRIFQISPRWETLAGGWRHWYGQTAWTVPKSAWEVELIVGNCVLIPAAAFRSCGLMNSVRYPNYGDAELTPRLSRADYTLIIDPRARVFCQPNAIPERVRSKSFRSSIRDLFIDLKSAHNLRRRLYANLDGAPDRLRGLAAFLVFLARAAVGRGAESRDADSADREATLSETYASKIIR